MLTHHVAIGPEGASVWVTDHATDRATILSARTGRVGRTIAVGPSPHHVAVLRSGAVVASHHRGTIGLFDPGGTWEGSVRVGRGPHGVAVARVPPRWGASIMTGLSAVEGRPDG